MNNYVSPYVREAAERAALWAENENLRAALTASQQYLMAWLPEYPPNHPQRKLVMDQLDRNSAALQPKEKTHE